MSSKEEFVNIKFDFYGMHSYDVISHLLLNTRCPWPLRADRIDMAPDGEVVYKHSVYYNGELSDKRAVAYKRKLGNVIFKAAMNIYWRFFQEYDTVNSIAKMRGAAHRLDKIILGDNLETTVMSICLMAEMLLGYKEKKNLLRTYPEEVKNEVIGHAMEPFKATAIILLEQQIAQMDEQFSAEMTAFDKEVSRQRDELRQKWFGKIDPLKEQIAKLRIADSKSQQATAAAAD